MPPSPPVPDLPLWLGVLKHMVRWPRGWGDLPFSMMDFCLCGAILNLKAFCFGAVPDKIIELIV